MFWGCSQHKSEHKSSMSSMRRCLRRYWSALSLRAFSVAIDKLYFESQLIMKKQQYLLIIFLILFQKKMEKQTFITHTEITTYSPSKPNQKPIQIKNSIKAIISQMPSLEICQQALNNLALPASMLDFQKVLKQIANQQNMHSILFTLNQLKSLEKEYRKLKICHIPLKEQSKNQLKINVCPSKLFSNHPERSIHLSQFDLKKAIEDELAFRNKITNFYSTAKLEKKSCELKKRVEKAKSMNKKAFKIYTLLKEKEEKNFENFKIETLYEPKPKHPKQKQQAKPASSQSNSISIAPSLKKLASSNSREKSPDNQIRCKTSNLKVKIKLYSENVDKENMASKISGIGRKIESVQMKRQAMEKEKENWNLQKIIKKNEKIIRLQEEVERDAEKRNKELVKKKEGDEERENLMREMEKLEENVIENKMKEQEEGKQRLKLIYLENRVNKIREDFRLKEERRVRHQHRKHQDLNPANTFNFSICQSYVAELKSYSKEGLDRCEAIKQRHDHLMQYDKQNQKKQQLKNLSTSELVRNLKRLAQKEQLRSYVGNAA